MEIVGITGANGFIGKRLCSVLRHHGWHIRPFVRDSRYAPLESMSIEDIGPSTDWSRALSEVATVIHTAAHVHHLRQPESELWQRCYHVNVEGTINLAQQASRLGVRRLIFLSSIKVNGEKTVSGEPFKDSSVPCPVDAYGNSKWEAERALNEIGRDSNLEIVIIRPPLVYGPGVKANFHLLMKLISMGIPLPLEGIINRRSFVAIDNLIDLVECCIDHPLAAGSTFLVSDDQDMSTPELVRAVSEAMGRPIRLFSAPQGLLTSGAMMLGRSEMVGRLVDCLQVDISKTKSMLNWSPPLTLSLIHI